MKWTFHFETREHFDLRIIYTPLFSKDTLYYKENEWYLSLESDIPYKVGTYILSIDAFIKDAKAHNEIFLNILKEGFKVSKID